MGKLTGKKRFFPKKFPFLWVILTLALLARLSAAIWWEDRVRGLPEPAGTETSDGQTDGPFYFGDSDSYWKLSRTLAFGRPYRFDEKRNWTIFRMPGYPAVLVPLFWLDGEHPPVFWGRVIGSFFGLLTVFLTYHLGTVVFRNRRVGLLAAFFAALDPSLIFQSVLILSEEPFTASVILQLLLLVLILDDEGEKSGKEADFSDSSEPELLNDRQVGRRQRRFGLGLAFGLVTAATVYFRPSWFDFLPFVAVFGVIYYFGRRLGPRFKNRRKKGRIEHSSIEKNAAPLFSSVRPDYRGIGMIFGVAILAFILAMSPWWLRNHRITGRFIPTTLQMGASLYDGLSPEADGASHMEFVDRFRLKVATENVGKPTERDFYEVRLDSQMKNAALDWAKNHPREAIRLSGVKFARLWNFWPNEPAFSTPVVRAVLLMTYSPLMVFAMIGVVKTFRRKFRFWLLSLPALYITALHLIFVSSLRYRIPVLPGLMILAAFAILALLRKLRLRVAGKQPRSTIPF